LLAAISKHHKVTFNWIKGHAGHPENERCDQLANMALNGNDLLDDV
jgi:ribonuclease HI